jgi:predicted P-loop ATPase
MPSVRKTQANTVQGLTARAQPASKPAPRRRSAGAGGPVRVTRQIDLQWFREHRAQLFAEALHYLAAGDRFHPNTKEQRELFEPQQQQRAVENAIESAIGRYLHDEQQRVPMGGDNGTLLNEVTLVELLNKVGIGIEKLGPGRFHEKQAAGALRKLGWVEARSSKPGRPRVYRRPAQPMSNDSLTRHDAGASTSEPDESIPF